MGHQARNIVTKDVNFVGAGSVARQIMGTTVIGGMLAASAVGIPFETVSFADTTVPIPQ